MSKSEILEHRAIHSNELLDTTHGVLNTEDLQYFEGLDYFDFDSSYQITAQFKKKKGKWFKMPTSTERLPVYRKYGTVTFMIDTTSYCLNVYQNKALRKKEGLKDYLFVPFKDSTSANESYGGGRYLDLSIPESDSIHLDFNLLYNPYCAYSHRYSCPIPPKENFLKVAIRAGEKTPLAH